METKLTSGLLFLLLLHLPTCVAQSDDPGDLKEMELRLKCPEILVKAEIGHDVTLNCSSEPQRDLTEDMFGWIFNESITVLLYKYKRFLYSWDEQFKYRSYPDSSWNVSKGKLSVKISSVNKNDSGIYECFVHINQRPIYCSAELIVGHQEDNNAGQTGSRGDDDTLPSDEKSLGASAIAGIVIGSLGLLALGIGVLWKKHGNHCGHGGEAGETIEGNRRNSAVVPEEVPLQRVTTHEPSTNTQE